MTIALPSKPGLTSAAALSIPKDWNPAWFRGFISNYLKGADVRNAVGSGGVTVSGTIASPYATIGFAGPVTIPGPVTINGTVNATALNVIGAATGATSEAATFTNGAGSQTWTVVIQNPSAASGVNFGLEVTAGTTTADTSLLVRTAGLVQTFRVDGAGNISGYSATAAALVDMSPDNGTFTGTLTGCTTAPTATFTWRRYGSIIALNCPQLLATSNSTSCTITGLPAAIQPIAFGSQWLSFPIVENNTALVLGSAFISQGAGTLTLSNGIPGNQASFTAAGTKGIGGSCTIYYLLK